jgi:hypothetical protein
VVSVAGVLQSHALSLTGERNIRRGFISSTSSMVVETTIIDATEMRGRFVQSGTTASSPTPEMTSRTSSTHEYQVDRIRKHAGDPIPCSRYGGDVPPPAPIDPPAQDMAGTWIGEYREVHCETNTAARCENGERGWVRVQISPPAISPAQVQAFIELGACSSNGTVKFGEPLFVTGPLELRRIFLTGLRSTREGSVARSLSIGWVTTILNATEMVGGMAVHTSEDGPGISASTRREHELPRVRKSTGPLPPCTPLAR